MKVNGFHEFSINKIFKSENLIFLIESEILLKLEEVLFPFWLLSIGTLLKVMHLIALFPTKVTCATSKTASK